MADEHLHLWLRMLFSCVVDADFLDTEKFMESDKPAQRGQLTHLSQLIESFDRFMVDKQAQVKDTPINMQRKAILAMCRKKASLPPGIFSLTAPTGSGKTLSALAFALEHARHHDKRRVIVAIPYTSIIEQTAAEYKKVLGEDDVTADRIWTHPAPISGPT